MYVYLNSAFFSCCSFPLAATDLWIFFLVLIGLATSQSAMHALHGLSLPAKERELPRGGGGRISGEQAS